MTTKNRTRKICAQYGGPLHDCRLIHHKVDAAGDGIHQRRKFGHGVAA